MTIRSRIIIKKIYDFSLYVTLIMYLLFYKLLKRKMVRHYVPDNFYFLSYFSTDNFEIKHFSRSLMFTSI